MGRFLVAFLLFSATTLIFSFARGAETGGGTKSGGEKAGGGKSAGGEKAGSGGKDASADKNAGGGAAPANPIVFDIGHVVGPDHPMHKAVEKFAEEMERRSGGTMILKIFPAAALGDEQKMCENVCNDTNAFTKISCAIVGSKVELMKVLSLPYLFRDEEQAWRVLEGEIGRELLDAGLDQNLKGICYFDAGARSFYAKKKAAAPEDLKGMKIRVPKSALMQKMVQALGALPQDVAFGDLYKSLESGTLDGAENNIPSYFTERHYKVAPFYLFDEHTFVPDVILMSAKRWNKLTPEQQNIITESAKVAVAFERDLWKRSSDENMKKMEAEGVTFTRLKDKTAFVEATKGIYDEFKGTKIMEYVERIRAAK